MEQLNLKLTLNQNGSVTASWSKITGAIRYEAYMYPIGESYAIYNEKNLVTTSYTSEAGLKANKQYKVVVAAYSSSQMIVSDGGQVLISSDFYNNIPLDVPKNVRAVSDTISVTVSFDEVDRATNYDVLFDGTVYNTTSTSKKITGLTPKTSHTYAVRAKNVNKTGEYSTNQTIKTLPQSPAIPSNIQKTVTETSATISWGAVSGATSYDLLFNGVTYNVTSTSKTITGLTAGTSYTFQLRAKNADASSEYGNTITVTTTPKPPATTSAVSNENSVTVTWSASAGASSYYVKFNGLDYLALNSPCNFTGLKPNTSYTYQVCARSADGSGTYTAQKTIMTSPKPPEFPSVTVTKNAVTLSWEAVSGATSYDVLFSGINYNVAGTSKTISGLTPGTSYTYAIRANNAGGSSTYGATQTITTLGKVPAVPASVKKAATEDSITISWDAVNGATGYDILFNGTLYSVTGTSKTVTGLSPNTSYTCQVRAKDADGPGAYSATQTVTTTPKAPANTSAAVSENAVTVSWDPVAGAKSYDILFNGTEHNVTGTSKTFTGLPANSNNTYQIRVKNSDGSSSYGSTRTIKTAPLPPSAPSVTPARDSITISWPASDGATSYDVLFNGTTYNVTGTSKTITGLTPGTKYSLAVRSNNKDGSSSYGATQTATTLPNPPDTPANVSSTATANSVTISWGAVSGATSYDVLLDGTTYNVTGTSKTITGLSPGTNYTYVVRANNSGGSSAYTITKTIQTLPNPPAAPPSVSASATSNSVTVNWSTANGATGYDVLFNGTTYDVTGTFRTFTGLTSDTNYNYAVRAKNAGGSSAYSTTQTVRTLPNPPAVPTNVNATATTDTVTISWSAVGGATSYDVSLNGTIYNVTGTSRTITGLTSGTNYSYAVCAKNAGGSSAYSSVKTIQTLPGQPAIPSVVSAVATSNSVTVSWSAVNGAAGYDVLFNGTTYDVTGTSRTFTGLTSDTNYNYAVRAKNAGGSSAYSTTQTVRTLPNPPAVPTNVNATATTDSITVNWDAVNGATSYDVSLNGKIYNVTGTSRTITGLMSSTNYNYAVCAKNAGGSGPYSSVKTIQTLQDVPEVPSNVTASARANSVTVVWSAVREATGYDIQFEGITYSVTETSRTFTGLISNTNYTYAVRANNAIGASEYSPTKTVRTLLDIPSDISATATSKTVTISFSPVIGATGYDIYFDGNICHAATTHGEFIGLIPQTNYTYAVRAKNSEVFSEFSKTETVRTLIASPDTSAASTLNSVMLSISPVQGATSYDVEFDGKTYRITDTIETFSASKTVKYRMAAVPGTHSVLGAKEYDKARISKAFSGLRPNTKHTYRAKVNSEYGSSDYSEAKTISTKRNKKSGLPNAKPKKTYPDGRAAHMGLDPVNALTGSFLWSYTYLEDFGKDDLHFTAMYDSQRDEYPKVLGCKWTYSLNYLLYMDDEYAYFSTPYDEVVAFSKNTENGSFQLAEGIQSDYTMGRREDQSYFVKDADDMEYIFDSNLSLRKIEANGITAYQFQVDKDGQIIRIDGNHGASLTLKYTAGHISKVADGMGNTVSFAYQDNYLVSAINTAGNGMSFIYDDSGNLLEITDFSGQSHLTNQYDIQNRVIAQNTAGRGNSFAAYDEVNRVTTFTDELGNTTKYYYDEALQVTSIELGETDLKSKYNEKGQLIEQIDGLGNSTQMAYDEKGRMNHVVYPDETEEHITYNDRNYPIKMVNRDGTEVLCEYDMRNNLVSVKDECGNVSSYFYDDVDNLISYMDKNGNIFTYSYDDNNHLSQAEDPEGNIYRYSHDIIGRLLSYTSPTESTITYQYSGTGNLTRIIDEDGTVAFDYDMNGNNTGLIDRRGNKQRLEYNEMGQVSLATDFMGNEYIFSYDKRGKLIRETDPLGYSQSYVYDAMGNNTAWTDKNGGATNYSFDAVGQLTEVKDAAGSLVKYSYDTMGQVKTVTDALNHQTNYTYDVMGRITSVTNALGQSVSYTYDHNGNLLTKTDESGAVIEYIYDNESRLSSSKSDAGITRFTYDKLGRLITVEDTEGHSEKVQYDGEGNVTEFSDKESRKKLYIYDKSGRLTEETDSNGGKTSYAYDPNGNCIKITDAEENEYSYEYDANNCMIKVKDPLGNETSYEYDVRGNLKSVADAKGGKTAFEYDGNSNLIKEVDSLSGVTTYSYDGLNRLTEVVDAEGHRRSFSYDAGGNMTSYTDANRNKWVYEYDAINRLTGVTGQDGGSMMFSYTKAGRIEKVTDQEGAETNYRYDSMGRLIEMSDALENSLSYTYDSLGRVLTQTDAGGNTTEYEYSPSGNLLRMKDPEGNATAYTYDALGQMLTETDALGNLISYEYDSLGQVIFITDAEGVKTSFTYTANGEIATVTDANGGITHYRYDACGNLTQLVDPLGNTVVYEYDAMNNQIKECLSMSQEQACATIYQYDKKGRIVREINPMSDEKTYTYDGNGNIVSIRDEDRNETTVRYDLNNKPVSMRYSDGREAGYRYNKRGELVELKDWNGTVTMEYGRTGRLAKVTDHNGRSTGYGYDANGNITAIDYPDGSVVNYTYDKNNRMTKVVDAEQQVTNYEYNPMGNVLSIRQPGSTSAYTYNAKGLPTQVKYQMEDGTFMENSFTYDRIGNIVSSDRKGSSIELTGSSACTYDALGQLLTYKEGPVTEAYGYDALGNRILKRVDGKQEASYQYNACNQLIAKTEKGIPYSYGYDKRGNLTEESCAGSLIKKYIYDATGHMSLGRNLESGEQTEYSYNALYMRIKNVQTIQNRPSGYRSYAGQADGNSLQPFKTREISYVTDYLSGANNELMSYEKDYGETRATYGRGYECLSRKVSLLPESLKTVKGDIASANRGKVSYQTDLLGSPLFASNDRGETLRYAKRGAWGDLRLPAEGDLNLAGVEDGMKFTNYHYDPVIDKYFAQARFYDSGQGRMLAMDPVRKGLNGYPYCRSNPVNRVDPTGEIVNVAAGMIGGFAFGGISGFADSVLEQIGNGEQFSLRKAFGTAINGAVIGTARGAMLLSGAGVAATGAKVAISLLLDFTAGVVGNALEQRIDGGKIDWKESLASGLTNAISGKIYGNTPLKSGWDAFKKGAKAGGAIGSIQNLLGVWDASATDYEPLHGGLPRPGDSGGNVNQIGTSAYVRMRDPKAGCGSPSPFMRSIAYGSICGYAYGNKSRVGVTSETRRTKKGGFDLVEFGKDTLRTSFMYGAGSIGFYGLAKKAGFLGNSVQRMFGNKGGSPTVGRPNSGQGFSPKGYNPKPVERTFNGYVKQNANPEVALYTKSAGFNNSRGNVGGQFKRLGAEEHYGLSPHVHQPIRNVAPNGTIYGKTGKTVGVDTLSPGPKDVKQLYEYLNNGKYHQ